LKTGKLLLTHIPYFEHSCLFVSAWRVQDRYYAWPHPPEGKDW